MASLHSRRVNNNLVYYSGNRYRALDAIGPNVKKFILDTVHLPIATDLTADGFTTTLVEAGAGESGVALSDGTLLISTDAAENDGVNMQVTGEAFDFGAGNFIYFGTSLQISDATQSDLLVGLCITDTDLLGGMTDGVYFRKIDGSASLNFVLEKNSTETASGSAVATMVDATNIILEFVFNGGYVDSYVDGVLQTRLAITNLPDDEQLTPSIHFLTGAAAVKTCRVNWLRVIQIDA